MSSDIGDLGIDLAADVVDGGIKPRLNAKLFLENMVYVGDGFVVYEVAVSEVVISKASCYSKPCTQTFR